MKKFVKVLLNIFYTIIAVIFGVAGAICLIPLAAIGLVISLPASIIADIWFPPDIYEIEENKESEE